MTNRDIKLDFNPGIELQSTTTPGISRAVTVDIERRFELTWDRFNRLHHTAKAVRRYIQQGTRILDVGGYDGALALFLPEFSVDVIDPITTGGSGLSIPEGTYPAVVAIDALEHIEPEQRETFLSEVTNTTSHHCFINFPARRTAEAQKLVYELTSNPLVKEHVIWELPEGNDVSSYLERAGFLCEVIEHTSLSQWLAQYLLQSVAPDLAARVNQHLLNQHLDEPVGIALYDLVVGTRTPG